MAPVKGQVCIMVQEVVPASSIPISHQYLLNQPVGQRSVYPERNELFIIEDRMTFLCESDIALPTDNIYKDWIFDGSNPDSHLLGMFDKDFFIRRIINFSAESIRPLSLSAPLHAELEIEAYGRDYLAVAFSHSKVISLPFTMFIDGFGLHRTSYRSILGVYIVPAGMTSREQTRRPNVFVLTLGPHGAKPSDVFAVVTSPLSTLDRGTKLTVNGEEIFVCAYTLAFTGDMPQQLANKGLMSQKANYGCGFCLIHSKERQNLNFDIQKYGRYHHRTLAVRRRGDRLNKTACTALFKEIGMKDEQTPLILFAPCLDLIRSRPPDMAHSEF
ncbi:MAG: hypothetical protein FRX48_03657 [Lasallia pustulata]|uniref:Uncharacterized protein n=1 Tax=Lasallia pustulata TaxID=136370 RepID=A0A5M8PUK2_9LECA|nr:MAG: hypothetical protein FRX48_03657 [Lasallia pustulata]